MWTTAGNRPHEEPDDDFWLRMSPPENELPVLLPQNLLLARTGDVAVALLGLRVHSTGVSFELTVRVRPPAVRGLGHRLDELLWAHGPGSGRFLLGVELADGRRVASGLPGVDGGDVVLHPAGGSGGESSVDQSWWLAPLPPEGPLRFVVRCPELGIPETVAELDATELRRAAERVVVLWPWSRPAPEGPEPPPPPDLPEDSWFARR